MSKPFELRFQALLTYFPGRRFKVQSFKMVCSSLIPTNKKPWRATKQCNQQNRVLALQQRSRWLLNVSESRNTLTSGFPSIIRRRCSFCSSHLLLSWLCRAHQIALPLRIFWFYRQQITPAIFTDALSDLAICPGKKNMKECSTGGLAECIPTPLQCDAPWQVFCKDVQPARQANPFMLDKLKKIHPLLELGHSSRRQ